MSSCWLAQFTPTPCSGHLVRVHLIPRQLLKRELDSVTAQAAIDDPRSWVLGCGGPMGNAGHHGQLDVGRTLRIPFHALPDGTVELADQLGLLWWLEREYQGAGF